MEKTIKPVKYNRKKKFVKGIFIIICTQMKQPFLKMCIALVLLTNKAAKITASKSNLVQIIWQWKFHWLSKIYIFQEIYKPHPWIFHLQARIFQLNAQMAKKKLPIVQRHLVLRQATRRHTPEKSIKLNITEPSCLSSHQPRPQAAAGLNPHARACRTGAYNPISI